MQLFIFLAVFSRRFLRYVKSKRKMAMMKIITVEFPFQLFHAGRYIDVIINGRPIGTVPNGGEQKFVIAAEDVAVEARYAIYRTEPIKLSLSDRQAAQLRVGTFRSNMQAVLTVAFGAALCWFRDSVNVYLGVAVIAYMAYMVYFSIINKKRYLFVEEVQES